MHEHIAAPAVLESGSDVPFAQGGIFHVVQDADIMTPWNLCNKLLHNWLLAPGCGERAHIFQVPRREAFHLGERALQIRRQAVDYFRAPVLALLPREDFAPDLPIEQHQLAINSNRRPELSGLDAALHMRQKLGVSGWYGRLNFLHRCHSQCGTICPPPEFPALPQRRPRPTAYVMIVTCTTTPLDCRPLVHWVGDQSQFLLPVIIEVQSLLLG